MIPVKYIGKRERYTEGTYGSKIEFQRGQTQLVPAVLAAKLLRHSDQYTEGDTQGACIATVEQRPQEDEASQDLRDAIATMDASALADYALTQFRVKLDKRRSVDALRSELTQMIDRFGVE